MIAATICALLMTAASQAAYVTPMIGGGQTGMMGAPMKHADVFFDGTTISIHEDTTVPTPILQPLAEGQQFDPAQPWAVLQDTAYNFQFAWNAGGFITLPAGGSIWVERLHHDDGLMAYKRPPAAPAYDPVFEADGDRWNWPGAMTHNVYAVLNPLQDTYTASYRVYIGDEVTGEPLGGYTSADVTWTWAAVPIPEPGMAAMLALAAAASVVRRKA